MPYLYGIQLRLVMCKRMVRNLLESLGRGQPRSCSGTVNLSNAVTRCMRFYA